MAKFNAASTQHNLIYNLYFITHYYGLVYVHFTYILQNVDFFTG